LHSESTHVSSSSRPPRAGARVLVVDDEPVLRFAMAELLRDEGYTVDEAGNGAVALEQAIAHKPDIVLFDYAMPVYDGPALVEGLRLVMRPVPILIGVSAIRESKAWCVDHGVPIFVLKPFEDSSLIRAVDSALKLARAAQQPRKQTASGVRVAVRSACVLAVGDLHGDELLHDILPESLQHARVVVVDSPEDAERVLALIVPDLLVLDDSPENDRVSMIATDKGVPILLRPTALSDARIAVMPTLRARAK
jgi:two-component system, response regulator, stage 0 sporulation protein F